MLSSESEVWKDSDSKIQRSCYEEANHEVITTADQNR